MRSWQKYPDTVFTAETLGCTRRPDQADRPGWFRPCIQQLQVVGFSWALGCWSSINWFVISLLVHQFRRESRYRWLFQEVNGNVAAMKQRYLFSALFSAGA